MPIRYNPANYAPDMMPYSGQQPFRFWCQKVLPLVYDDSLSYYELLNKVVTYLNNTIQDVANVESNVDALNTSFSSLEGYVNSNVGSCIEAYNELESFVNNYFASLDVQEEINTKLDAMASDGTLSALVIATGAIPDAVSAWLEENITPTTPVVDATLSVSGAAADAKVTGDKINSGFATAKYHDVQQDEINEVVYPYNHFDQRKDSVETAGSMSTINGWYREAWIDQTTGEPISHPTSASPYYAVTRLIPVYDASTLYTKSGSGQLIYPSIASPNSSAARIRGVAKYDGDGNFLSYRPGPMGAVSIEPEVAFIRIERTYSNMANLNQYTLAEDQIEGTEYQTFTEPYSGLRQAISEYVAGQGQLNNDALLNLVQIFKKVTGVGDSIMAGFMNRNGVSVGSEVAKTAGNNWISYLGMRTGCTITNLAVGGSSSHDWRVTYLSNANIDTDAYFVMLGTNDLRDGLTIGTSADINTTDKTLNADTFYGNMDYIINSLRTFKPNAHIVVLTVPAVVQSGDGPNGRAVTPVNTALRYICGLYTDHVHLIDLDAYATDFDRPIVSGNYSIGHFNPIAYNFMSAIIERAINRYMYDNQDEFPTTPYA